MAIPYESMELKEIFQAGKKAGIVVPLHLRGPNAIHDPKLLEEARQYLVTQLNALYLKKMAKQTQRIVVLTLIIVIATLAMVVFFYLHPPENIRKPLSISATPQLVG